MNTTELEQELELLNAQIEQVRGTLTVLDGELRATEAELETITDDRLRFDALRDACKALERLEKLEASELFWGDLAELKAAAAHVGRLQTSVARFDGEISGKLERQANLQQQINQRLEELEYLYEGVDDAHLREERRQEEFLIERELSAVPDYPLIMPWSFDAESERRYRRAIFTTMAFSLILASVIQLVVVPKPVRPVVVEIPKRLAMMVRKEHKKPEPVKKTKEDKKKEEEKKEVKKERKEEVKERAESPVQAKPLQERPRGAAIPERAVARDNAQTKGVLAFKDSFKDLIEETPVARLGVEARVSNNSLQSAGQSVASRSLVAMPAGGGSSGGIGNAAVSRNVGNGRGNDTRLGRGDGGFSRMQSGITGGTGKEKVASAIGTKEGKRLTSGAGPSRTDEEIQILFDRYKAALYRIYNTELRKNPALRGKMVLRLAIEPSGAVSSCQVESSNMDAPEFSAQIVERVKKINFGPKDGVPKTTILYPIDFLPAR